MPQSSQARRLAQGAVPTSPTLVHTVDVTQREILASLGLHNSAVVERSVTVWVVPDGQSMANSNQFRSESLKAGRSYQEGGIALVLEPGDTVYMDADGADVSYWLSGAVLTDV